MRTKWTNCVVKSHKSLSVKIGTPSNDKNEVTNITENPLHDNEKNIFVSIKYNNI